MAEPSSLTAGRLAPAGGGRRLEDVTNGRSGPTDPDVAQHSELEAIAACRAGDRAGLATLYELYAEKVLRTCYRILGERAAAEDALQEIFIGLSTRLRGFRGSAAFSTWLYRVAVNHALNALRGRRRRRARFSPIDDSDFHEPAADPMSSPIQRCLEQESQDRVRRLLGALSPDHRAAITLREIEGLSYREIAEVLEVPRGTVMSRLSRARQALLRVFEHQQTERRNRRVGRGVPKRRGGSQS